MQERTHLLKIAAPPPALKHNRSACDKSICSPFHKRASDAANPSNLETLSLKLTGQELFSLKFKVEVNRCERPVTLTMNRLLFLGEREEKQI